MGRFCHGQHINACGMHVRSYAAVICGRRIFKRALVNEYTPVQCGMCRAYSVRVRALQMQPEVGGGDDDGDGLVVGDEAHVSGAVPEVAANVEHGWHLAASPRPIERALGLTIPGSIPQLTIPVTLALPTQATGDERCVMGPAHHWTVNACRS